MKKFLGALTALVLGLTGAAVLGPLSASAHNYTDFVNCATAEVHLANYDGGATVKITLDGVVVQPTIPFGGSFHYTQALSYNDATPTHTMVVEVLSNDPGYSFTHTKSAGADCYTPTAKDASATLLVIGATCDAPGSATWTGVANADVTVLDQTVGAHDGTATAWTKHQFSDGTTSQTTPYTIQPKIYNASCVPPVNCIVVGPYHENDDNAATLTPTGLAIYSKGDGKATDGGGYYLSSGNAQGITTFDYTKTNEIGNGIYFRLIFDLSADGGPSYASFSGLGQHVDQSTVAGYGSKAVFNGLSIADVANAWPKNKLVAFIWQTGSSYAAGDGATLTGFSGYCGSGNLVPTVPADTHRVTDTNGDVVCTSGGVGGGSYDETITHYTTSPVWNAVTQSYDMIETVDPGYPQVINHLTDPSLASCPIHATPVDPTATPVCDADDTIALATTANITYAITAHDKNGATVTATPAADTVLDAAAGWTINGDGTATFTIVYDSAGCPITIVVNPDGTLALTGSDPTILLLSAGGAIAFGVFFLAFKAYRRRQAREDEGLLLLV